MPVFDFSGSDNKNKNIVTYETFQSSERTATAEKPIMLLENSTRKWAHHRQVQSSRYSQLFSSKQKTSASVPKSPPPV